MNRRLLVALLATVSLSVAACGGSHPNEVSVKTGTSSETAAATTTECPSSWGRADSDKAGNRWFADGIPAIGTASNSEEARKAASDWMNGVRKDPVLLAGAAKVLVHKDVDKAGLFDSKGCATSQAVDLVAEMEAALALSTITPSEAPATGYNSGTHDGVVVGSSTPGIAGDRKAIQIVLPDGTKIWIMRRCGNPVTEGKSGLPEGPTDNQPPPATPVCPSDKPYGVPPNCYGSKNPGQSTADSPDQRSGGNGPEEGGSDEGGPHGPASTPGETYNPPAPPTSTVTPTTRPNTPPPPSTTTAPPNTEPPNTTTPPLGTF